MAPKYQMVADSLRTDILDGVYQKRMLLPTEQLLCQQFQVSRQTVRQALALLVSEGLIERRQGSGSHIRDRSMPAPMPRRSIAVITTYISDYIFPSILREVENVLSDHNSAPLLFATQNQVSNERKVLNTLLDLTSLDGVLVEGTKTGLPNPNLDLYQEITARGIPMVFLHGYYREMPDCLSVLDDNYRGGRMLVEYLYNKGHRAIMGLFKNDDIQGLQRYSGYLEGLRDLGLPLDQQHVFWYNTETKTDLLQEDEPWEQVLKTLEGCTAAVCYNDEVASRLVSILVQRGKRVPQDVAVVSFDNSAYSQLAPVPITSLSHGTYNVGQMAAQLLVDLFHGKKGESMVAPWELVERQSS